jgi:hypothetical protein
VQFPPGNERHRILAMLAKVVDEARRIAANIAKLPVLLATHREDRES